MIECKNYTQMVLLNLCSGFVSYSYFIYALLKKPVILISIAMSSVILVDAFSI